MWKNPLKECDAWANAESCFWLLQSYSHHLVRCYPLSSIPSAVCIGLSAWKEGLCDLFLSCEGNKSHNPSLQADKRLVFTSARIPQGTGVPNDGFLLTTSKTLFRLKYHRVVQAWKEHYFIFVWHWLSVLSHHDKCQSTSNIFLNTAM